MTIAQRVKRLRIQRGWEKSELAERAAIDRTLLSRIESGSILNPGANVLKGLARALGCSIDYLVGLYDDYDHAGPVSVAGTSKER
jgi:transcriptional regulator with XRE-family HTH domain